MTNVLLFAEQSFNFVGVMLAFGITAGFALVMGVLILVVSHLCAVEEDPRIKQVEGCLAGANCGGCGYPGCGGYAKALVDGTANLDACGQTCADKKAEICGILGVEMGSTEPTICVNACCGGTQCNDKYSYQGLGDCVSQNALAGGSKACSFGCMGAGSCADACPYGAIEVKDGYAQIDPALCRSCGICISTCPKKLIKRIPASAKVFVACSSECRAKEVMSQCKVGCIACGKCARVCPNGAITMVNNVPVIDYSKCTNCGTCAEGCPRHCIKYVHGDK